MKFIMNTRLKMVIASGATRLFGTCRLSLTCVSTKSTSISAKLWKPLGALPGEWRARRAAK